MDELVKLLAARIADDHHAYAYAYVAHTLGGEALLDSHLPMLDLTEQLADDYRTMAHDAAERADASSGATTP